MSNSKGLHKWGKKHSEFLLNKMYDDKISVSKVFQLYGDQLPSERTYYRYIAENEELDNEVTKAYEAIMSYYHKELEDMANLTDTEYFIKCGKALAPYECIGSIKYEAKNYKIQKMKIYMEFLRIIAPILTKKYSKKQQVEVKGEVQQKVTYEVIDYSNYKISKDITPVEYIPKDSH